MLGIFIKNEAVLVEKYHFEIPKPTIKDIRFFYGKGDVQVIEKTVMTDIPESRIHGRRL